MPVPHIKLGLVDDHKLFRKGLINLIEVATNNSASILFEASNGYELKEQLNPKELPDIILMDINMPGMNGFECVVWLRKNYPMIKILVVSMMEKEDSILKMLSLGVKGYINKDVEPKELGEAIMSVANKGFYYTDFITGKLVHSLTNPNTENLNNNLTLEGLNDREKEFLRHSCSELTYNEIAAKMYLSPKTIDGYRKALFEKLSVKNRVGMALYAVKFGLVIL